jgi:hypothetical protein
VSRGWLAGLLLLAGAAGPFDIALFNTPKAPTAKGTARLVYSPSPFGIAVTATGVASYQVQLELSGLPDPASLGAFTTYVAWSVTSDLSQWDRLGAVKNGATTVGHARLNKFLLVVTAEPDSAAPRRVGPTVLHGSSPSSWLQSFVTHPLFRGIPPQ